MEGIKYGKIIINFIIRSLNITREVWNFAIQLLELNLWRQLLNNNKNWSVAVIFYIRWIIWTN